MAATARGEAAGRPSGFAVWRLVVWLLLLLAGYAAVQYLRLAEYAYLAAACAVVVICAGCLLRQGWGRDAMRVAALLLALWAAFTGASMLAHWDQFEQLRQQAQAQPQLADMALMMVERVRRSYQIVLAAKALAVPVLLWLAWRLGRPEVRAQFRTGS
jgi:hypothetical protein